MADFDQSRIWVDREGIHHDIATMDRGHAARICGFLEKRANSLHFRYSLRMALMPGPSGDMASMIWDDELEALDEMSPLEWLRSTRLFKALYERANPDPMEALDRIVEMFVIPGDWSISYLDEIANILADHGLIKVCEDCAEAQEDTGLRRPGQPCPSCKARADEEGRPW